MNIFFLIYPGAFFCVCPIYYCCPADVKVEVTSKVHVTIWSILIFLNEITQHNLLITKELQVVD